MSDKAVLVIDMPKDCPYCPMAHWNKLDEFTGCDAVSGKKYAINDKEYAESSCRPSWCPLIHPLKEVSNDFYIYDTEYLFKNLDREIDLLKSTERFKEYMRNREE